MCACKRGCYRRSCWILPTFLLRQPALQPLQDADFGLLAQVGGSLCRLGQRSHIVQLHLNVGEVSQRAGHTVEGNDELGAVGVAPVLADARR